MIEAFHAPGGHVWEQGSSGMWLCRLTKGDNGLAFIVGAVTPSGESFNWTRLESLGLNRRMDPRNGIAPTLDEAKYKATSDLSMVYHRGVR